MRAVYARLPDHTVRRVQHEGDDALVLAEHREFEVTAGFRLVVNQRQTNGQRQLLAPVTRWVGLGVGFEVILAVGIGLLRQTEERMLRRHKDILGRASIWHRASPYGLVLLAVVGNLIWCQHCLFLLFPAHMGTGVVRA